MDDFNHISRFRRYYIQGGVIICGFVLMSRNRRIRVEKKQLERFDFIPLRAIRTKVNEKPELENSLRTDFEGVLKAEGVKVDDAFLTKVKDEWRAQISEDIREKVSVAPERYPLLSRVLSGKPIRVHLKVDEKGRCVKTKEVRG